MIEVGDRVRSYDFPFDDEIYVEGIVQSIEEWEHCEFNCGLPHIAILVDIDTFPEGPSRIGEIVYPVDPWSGAMGFFPPNGNASRVEVI